MEAQELHLGNGKSTGIFFCGKCRHVASSKESAEECCAPPKCKTCGEVSENRHLECRKCTEARFEREERERFEKAEKVDGSKYAGWVYADNLSNHNNGYFESIEEIFDLYAEDEWPEYVWCCDEVQFVCASFDDAIEGCFDRAPEDWDSDELEGVDELKAAIEKFNAANAKLKSYHPDYSRAIVLKK